MEIEIKLSESLLAHLKLLAQQNKQTPNKYLEDVLQMYLAGQLELKEFDSFYRRRKYERN